MNNLLRIPKFLAEYINFKSWITDLKHENGAYLNTCNQCKSEYLGHKRRMQCYECAAENTKNYILMTDEGRQALKREQDSLKSNPAR